MVIRAFELGFLDKAPEIDDPVRTFKEISVDTDECKWVVKLKNGERTDAVSILQFYLEAIERMYEYGGEEMGKWDEIGKKGLEEVIDKLESRCMEKYVDGIDWVTKLALLASLDEDGAFRGEPKERLSASEGLYICNQYALLDESVLYYVVGEKESIKSDCLFNPVESLAFATKELPQVDWSSLSDRVKYALSNAPENTREFFKAEMLKRYGPHVRSVSWSTMVLDEAKIILDEPFMLNKGEIGEEMIEGREIEEVLSAAKRLYPDKLIS